MTIIEAIVNVLKEHGKPLAHKDIYDCIIIHLAQKIP